MVAAPLAGAAAALAALPVLPPAVAALALTGDAAPVAAASVGAALAAAAGAPEFTNALAGVPWRNGSFAVKASGMATAARNSTAKIAPVNMMAMNFSHHGKSSEPLVMAFVPTAARPESEGLGGFMRIS